eukprot:6122723-Alexandrium_andersonii.AAC.1
MIPLLRPHAGTMESKGGTPATPHDASALQSPGPGLGNPGSSSLHGTKPPRRNVNAQVAGGPD